MSSEENTTNGLFEMIQEKYSKAFESSSAGSEEHQNILTQGLKELEDVKDSFADKSEEFYKNLEKRIGEEKEAFQKRYEENLKAQQEEENAVDDFFKKMQEKYAKEFESSTVESEEHRSILTRAMKELEDAKDSFSNKSEEFYKNLEKRIGETKEAFQKKYQGDAKASEESTMDELFKKIQDKYATEFESHPAGSEEHHSALARGLKELEDVKDSFADKSEEFFNDLEKRIGEEKEAFQKKYKEADAEHSEENAFHRFFKNIQDKYFTEFESHSAESEEHQNILTRAMKELEKTKDSFSNKSEEFYTNLEKRVGETRDAFHRKYLEITGAEATEESTMDEYFKKIQEKYSEEFEGQSPGSEEHRSIVTRGLKELGDAKDSFADKSVEFYMNLEKRISEEKEAFQKRYQKNMKAQQDEENAVDEFFKKMREKYSKEFESGSAGSEEHQNLLNRGMKELEDAKNSFADKSEDFYKNLEKRIKEEKEAFQKTYQETLEA